MAVDAADHIEDAVFHHWRRPRATVGLLSAMLIIHVWISIILWMRGWMGPLAALTYPRPTKLLVRWGAMRDIKLDAGEFWRLISCVFLHGDGLHMLLNGVALFALGRLCESLYGAARFVWLFLLCGMCGATFSWLGGNTTSVGASGGIFGLMGAAMVFGWRYRQQLPDPMSHFLRRSLLPWVVLNLVIGLLLPFIDNLGHIGGLLAGILLAMVIGNQVIPGEQSPMALRTAMAMGSTGLLVMATWGVAHRWYLL